MVREAQQVGGVERRLTEEETRGAQRQQPGTRPKRAQGSRQRSPRPGLPGRRTPQRSSSLSMRRPAYSRARRARPHLGLFLPLSPPSPSQTLTPLCEADARACCSRAAANADLGVGGQCAGLRPPCLLSPGSTHDGRRPSLPTLSVP